MAVSSTATLLQALRQYRLLDTKELDELATLENRFPDPKALAGELIRRGLLTPYQANQLLQGRGQQLLLGSYVLQERLGEGGMGEVFKARNWKLDKVVALKLIRKERLNNPDAVRRFQREVRAAAALNDPNIVHALDADEIGGTHLLVMECIEGATDLSRLVKKNGPLPVPQACEYIRQAALGLQHAFERGLVHRDIKPHNLLLTADRKTVKILDMGLARQNEPMTEHDKSSTMTQEGAVMGTPDYIAPEQARDSHTADIRADLYSLGCTLYYLLTGQVPFPGGTLIQKLTKHQFEEAKPVEALRPDIPPGVARVARKLMAKKRDERYQTPAEAAAALAAVFNLGGRDATAAGGNDRTLAEGGTVVTAPTGDTFHSAFADLTTSETAPTIAAPPPPRPKAQDRRWLLFSIAGGALVCLTLAVILLSGGKETGGKKSPVKEGKVSKRPAVPVDDAWLQQVAGMPADKQVEAVAAKLKELNPRFDGTVTPTYDGDLVTALTFLTDHVTDISPVKALRGLKSLACGGNDPRKGELFDLAPLTGMELTSLNCSDTQVVDLSPLKGMKLTHLSYNGTWVVDLAPLKNMKLTRLECANTPVSDLSPLKDMKLTDLNCAFTQVSNLSLLQGMLLTNLNLEGSKVSDLAPLKGMPLRKLICNDTAVFDLSPLKGMNLLTFLACQATPVSDLSPLKGIPLKQLSCDFKPFRDTENLRSIKSLERISGKPAAEFWKEADDRQAAFEVWRKEVAAMPGDKQVEAVAAKLKELNPGFDGKLTHQKQGDVVTALTFCTNQVSDITPVRAFADLRNLQCDGLNEGGKLADLSPLTGMRLSHFSCNENIQVRDLSPLRGMPLTSMILGFTQIADLSPLRGMPLVALRFNNTSVKDISPLKGLPLQNLAFGGWDSAIADLTPLKGAPLTFFGCSHSSVSDLSPLADSPLEALHINNTRATDLSVLKKLPLKSLICDFKPWRDTEILRSIKTLETINSKPAKEFWKEAEAQQAAFEAWCKQVAALPTEEQVEAVAAKLKELNPGFDGKVTHKEVGDVVTELHMVTDNVTDISPVRALTGLQTFSCNGTENKRGKLADLWPLKGLHLKSLSCNYTEVADLKPMTGMSLTTLHCKKTKVADLSPLKNIPLKEISCDFKLERDADVLRAIKSLEKINDSRAKEFWSDVDNQKNMR